MKLEQIIDTGTIIPELRAESKREAFAEMAAALKSAGRIRDLEGFLRDVEEREKIEVTDLGNGIAIPHAQSCQVLESGICVGRKTEGLAYSAGGDPVRLIVMFAAGSGEGENRHLALLSRFARMMVYEEFITEMMEAGTAREILNVIRKYERIAGEDR